ncbi:hypothetical protein [Ligilactobacillus cholophilus]|uniref:hypothetical protein n=1 Tax=Ligilactobacillus cholophilus TaxID=3050131 RepID=UPI0025B1AFEF|nr:hypothetical protein [Ligilactobacillus cholophilus]
MENNKIKNAKIGFIIGILIQIILCCLNFSIFGWFTLVLLAYLIWGFIKLKKDKTYWIKIQKVFTVIIILEVLVSLPLLYLFQHII